VYDAPHAPRPWGWRVSTYLWTKSIAAGALMMAALTLPLERAGGMAADASLLRLTAPALALLFLAITTGLLVLDLKRPDRFLYVLFRSNPRSWLVRGSWILMADGGVAALWLLAGISGHGGLQATLVLPALLLGAATAGYSAFLFGQAEGRDFWQSPLLLPHLLVAARSEERRVGKEWGGGGGGGAGVGGWWGVGWGWFRVVVG